MREARNINKPHPLKTPSAKSETEYRKTIAALEERLQLQELISDISTILVNLPAAEVDGQIKHGLQRIVEFMGIDRSAFGEFSPDMEEIHITHAYGGEGIAHGSGIILTEALPWFSARLQRGEVFKLEHPDDLPEEAAAEIEYCQQIGLKSNLSIPVSVGGSMICVLAFTCFHSFHAWPEEVIDQLKRVAEVFAYAVYRKRTDLVIQNHVENLEKQLQFEMLLANISAQFVNLNADHIDREIEDAQRRVCECLDLDLCAVWQQTTHDQEKIIMTHLYPRLPGSPQLETMEASIHYPWVWGQIRSGSIVKVSSLAELPLEAARDRENAESSGIKSSLTLPLSAGGESPFGAVAFNATQEERTWPEEIIMRLKLVAEIFAQAIYRKRAEEKLQKSFREIKQLKDRLQAEADYLRTEIKVNYRHGEIIGESAAIQAVIRQVEQVAPTNSSVLISGETGVGKEVVARAIHTLSPRKNRAMVKVNCASLPSTLVESELFGREKGAYTGAMSRQPGRFEVADGSTIFLDEIAELSPELQAKLLRVLQEGEFERLGSPKTIKVDVRVIAATNRNLTEAVREGTFREDLYYRLNVFPIVVPPLRERPEDIPSLVHAFIEEFGEKMGKKTPPLTRRTLETLQRYHWPGNIREVRNVIEHAIIISSGKMLQVTLPKDTGKIVSHILTLQDAERQHISEVLEITHWRVKGAHGAAELLGLHPSTLYSKMRKLGIPLQREKDDISSRR